jgi:hypothetical protein
LDSAAQSSHSVADVAGQQHKAHSGSGGVAQAGERVDPERHARVRDVLTYPPANDGFRQRFVNPDPIVSVQVFAVVT